MLQASHCPAYCLNALSSMFNLQSLNRKKELHLQRLRNRRQQKCNSCSISHFFQCPCKRHGSAGRQAGDNWGQLEALFISYQGRQQFRPPRINQNFLSRWKTFHFQISTIQQWTTERKEPIHNSNKKTKLLEILERSSHQNLHLQRTSCCIRTCTTSHHSQFKDNFIGKTSSASVTHM